MNGRFQLTAVSVLILSMFCVVAYADHSWSNYHWARTANPFILRVVDSVTSDWNAELGTALSDWSASDPLSLAIIDADDSKRSRRRCRMINGQIRVCNDSYGLNGWLGLATIGIDSNGHIDRGTAKLNDSYSSYWTDEQKQHVMCQEIGHLFGLGHTSEDGSSQQTCMDYSQDTASQWPNQHDYELLAEIYEATDSYDSYDGAPSGGGESGGGGGCNAPAGKGCNKNRPLAETPPMGIRVSRNGDSEIWVAPRNDGGLWIHHIRLVPEG